MYNTHSNNAGPVQETINDENDDNTITDNKEYGHPATTEEYPILGEYNITTSFGAHGFSNEAYLEIYQPVISIRNLSGASSPEKTNFMLTDLKSYYLIPFLLMLCCCVAALLVWVTSKSCKNVLDSNRAVEKEFNFRSKKQYMFRALMILLELFRSSYAHGVGSLMVTYVIKVLRFDKTTASDISFTFFVTSAVVPIPMVLLLRYIRPKILLCVDLVITTSIMVITWLMIEKYVFLIWVWAALCGGCVSGGEAPCYSWYNERNTASASETSFMVTAFALGAMVGPAMTGIAMSLQNPAWFMHSLLGIVILADVAYIAAFIADRY